MPSCDNLRVKIYADGADLNEMLRLARNPLIKGLTTNPTLMAKANITDYESFAHTVLNQIRDLPISFEVFADDLYEMEQQALQIKEWGPNVYVKIPVTNTRGESTSPILYRLARAQVKLNVTAIFTLEQVHEVCEAIQGRSPSVISVFAGRIADTGLDPMPLMSEANQIVKQYKNSELLWASPREILNIFQADEIDCDIITVSHSILSKLNTVGKDLTEFSRETVQMFYDDAVAAGFKLTPPARRQAA